MYIYIIIFIHALKGMLTEKIQAVTTACLRAGVQKLYKWTKEKGRKYQVHEVKKRNAGNKLHLRMNDMIIFIHLY